MLKIGMVGAGGIANSHSAALEENKDCILTVVCDIDSEKAQKIAEVHGAKVCTDYKEIDGVDAVIINLPHFLHCEVACHFMEKGINVLVEKPMANTVEECDKMIAVSKKTGTKLAVGHVQKYFSSVREIKKIIDSEKYGKLCMIYEVRNTDYLKGRPAWFLNKKQAGGGIVINYGPHSLDRIFYTTGLGVEKMHYVTSNPLSDDDIELNAQILLELEKGVTASITYSGCHTPAEYEVTYYFTHGAVKIKNAVELWVYEDSEFKNLGGDRPLMQRQLAEFVKYLNNEENEVAKPDYGREIVRLLEEIVQ